MRKKLLHTLFATTLVVFVGCSNPADNVPEAEVAEPAKAVPIATVSKSEPTVAPVAAKSYVIGGDSKIDFVGSKAIGGEQPGGFKKFVGQLNVQEGQLLASGSKIVIDMKSLWTNTEKLTGHLKHQDFFNVEKIPTSTFAATKIESIDGKQKITGDLTMHGITKSISFPAEIAVADDTVALKAEFFINRFDFEMKYPGQADNLIRKEVVLSLNVKATPGEADFSSLEKSAGNQ